MSSQVTNCIPTPLNDLLVKLKILSMIERGKKVNMGNMTFTDASSWLGAINRTLSGESRKSFMLYLNQTIQQTINAIDEYKDTEFAKIIVNDLSNAKIGIQNLTTTYQGDPAIIAAIEICIANIDLQLEKNRELLDGHQILNLNRKRGDYSIVGDNFNRKSPGYEIINDNNDMGESF